MSTDRRVWVEESDGYPALAAQLIAQGLCRRLERADRVSLFLAGGTTPEPVYRRLARTPLAWGEVDFYWGDERCVGPENERSNYRTAARALLGPLGIPVRAMARIHGELGAEAAARQYEGVLAARFGPAGTPAAGAGSEGRSARDRGATERASAISPDLVLLGLGSDGHVASLFPGGPFDPPDGRRVMAVRSPRPSEERVSLGGSFLASGREVFFLVTGGAKASRMAAVLAGEDGGPAAEIARRARRVTWVLDAEAAAELPARW